MGGEGWGAQGFQNDIEFPRGEIMPLDDCEGNYLIAVKKQGVTVILLDTTHNIDV